MQYKHILVAGGAGFVGSHLCEHLLNNNYHVIAVDNLSTGSLINVQHLLPHPKFKFIKQDITERLNIGSIDYIFNLASPASPKQYQQQPIPTITSNVLGSIELLQLAKRCNATILLASTSEVYGDPQQHPQQEEYWGHVNPVGVRACYDEAKRCAETIFMEYHRQHKLKIKIARIFNTYGPNMLIDDGRVISNFIVAALNNQPINIHGNGQQTRSFCFVSDLVDGLTRLILSDDQVTGPINLGNPTEVTIEQIADMILNLTQSKSQLIHTPLPPDDPARRCPDISKAKVLLGYQPKVSLQEGLIATIYYFLDELARFNYQEKSA